MSIFRFRRWLFLFAVSGACYGVVYHPLGLVFAQHGGSRHVPFRARLFCLTLFLPGVNLHNLRIATPQRVMFLMPQL